MDKKHLFNAKRLPFVDTKNNVFFEMTTVCEFSNETTIFVAFEQNTTNAIFTEW